MSTVKLTIDGKEVEVPKGTRVIEAAKKVDTDIPFYCYHPGLSIAGNCRMCLVEVEKMPKLQIACHMEARDGMVVRTKTPVVQETRKHILEFLLINHPVDCPVCDQAGECWLQDYYMRYGTHDSRLNENKLKKKKAVPLGPTVMLDQERCILCSRCVRFTDEISKTQELGIINRGDHSEVDVFPGKELNNPYSGNVVDICPVGALTDRDFRFKMRVWYLKTKATLCNGCSRGCNIEMQYGDQRPHHAKGDRVMRLKPRYNEQINQWWMCDEGRYGYKFHDHNRILNPLNRSEGKVEEKSWEQILPEAAKLIEAAKGQFGVFVSPQLSNEEIFLIDKLFRKHLQSKNLFLVSPTPDGFQDDFLIRADKNPNSKGAEWQHLRYQERATADFFAACAKGQMQGAIIFGQDLLTLHGAHLAQPALQKLKWSLFIGSNHNLTAEFATHLLPAATYAEKEGTFTNFEGRTQKFNQVLDPIGDARPEWQILSALGNALGLAMKYDRTAEIFAELVRHVEAFKDLDYAKLKAEHDSVRRFAAPMVPSLVQQAGLIFPTAADAAPKPTIATPA